MAKSYRVEVVLRTGDREIESPKYDSKDEALGALNTIREAAKTGEWIELEWLAVNGGEVLVASLKERGAAGGTLGIG